LRLRYDFKLLDSHALRILEAEWFVAVLQIKSHDDYVTQQTLKNKQSQAASKAFQEEIRFLKNKVIELQSQMEDIEEYIEDQLDGKGDEGYYGGDTYGDDASSINDYSVDTGFNSNTSYHTPQTPKTPFGGTGRSSGGRNSFSKNIKFSPLQVDSNGEALASAVYPKVFSPMSQDSANNGTGASASNPSSAPNSSNKLARKSSFVLAPPIVTTSTPKSSSLKRIFHSDEPITATTGAASSAVSNVNSGQVNDNSSKTSSSTSTEDVLRTPVSAADSRLYLDEENAGRFDKIVEAFQLSQTLLDYALKEEKMFREYTTQSLQATEWSDRENNSAIYILQEQLAGVSASKGTISHSLASARGKEESLQKKVYELEAIVKELKSTVYDLSTKEKSASQLVREYENQRSFGSMQLRAARDETDQLKEKYDNLLSSYDKITAKFTSLYEEKSIADSKSDLLCQEYTVLEAERDELVKRFINNQVSSPVEFIRRSKIAR
jgi:predicted  nucleic acid-binding Zn-ribbon protein